MKKIKAESDPMKFLVGALIVLVVGFILIYLYNSWFGSAKNSGDGIIDMTHTDCDKDGKMYLFDNCVQNLDKSIPGCEEARPKGEVGCE